MRLAIRQPVTRLIAILAALAVGIGLLFALTQNASRHSTDTSASQTSNVRQSDAVVAPNRAAAKVNGIVAQPSCTSTAKVNGIAYKFNPSAKVNGVAQSTCTTSKANGVKVNGIVYVTTQKSVVLAA